jgi:hypothetical protein
MQTYRVVFMLHRRECCELVQATSLGAARMQIETENAKAIVLAVLPVGRELRSHHLSVRGKRAHSRQSLICSTSAFT